MTTLEERGYTVLGLCPDLPGGLQQVHAEKKLNFSLYSDSAVEVADALGIAFHMDNETVTMYRNQYKIDIEKASGQRHHNLPVPAVIVRDASGSVTFVYTNADHKVRLRNEELLEAAP